MTYFHKLADDEREALEDSGATWAEVVQAYEQPSWCAYHLALNGVLGCWSLVGWSLADRRIRTEDDCKGCDLYQPGHTVQV